MSIEPPVKSFSSKGKRKFAIRDGVRSALPEDNPKWNETWEIENAGELAGKLVHSVRDQQIADAEKPAPTKKWHVTIDALYRSKMEKGQGILANSSDEKDHVYAASEDGTSVFDDVKDALDAWAMRADQIYDYAEKRAAEKAKLTKDAPSG